MRKSVWIACVGMACAGCQPQAARFSEQDATAVRAIFDSVVTDVRTGNWDVWGNRFAADARFHPANAPGLAGRAAIVGWARSLPPLDSFGFGDVRIAGDGRLAYGSSTVRFTPRGMPAVLEEQLVIFTKDSTGRWLVQAATVASDQPPPPSATGTRR